jgi:hypothetical protein
MSERVGACVMGMMRMCEGKGRLGKIFEVGNGPLAVVRYASVAMDVMMCVGRFGLERQK